MTADLNRTIEQIRPAYQFEVSCQKSVPEAIIAFLSGTDYESTIRLAENSFYRSRREQLKRCWRK